MSHHLFFVMFMLSPAVAMNCAGASLVVVALDVEVEVTPSFPHVVVNLWILIEALHIANVGSDLTPDARNAQIDKVTDDDENDG